MDEVLHIDTASHSYPIFVQQGAIAQAEKLAKPYIKGSKVIIVTDEQVHKHYGDALLNALSELNKDTHVIILPAGEATKSFSHFETLCDDLLSYHPDRQTTLIALGGGVIGDITGFAASVLLRGVPFIQVPTTLLAQVDSSVGGKTGINTHYGKNLIGSFYQPQAVITDTDTLDSLPKRELLAGYAEIIKYGLLGNETFYQELLESGHLLLQGDHESRIRIIQTCCEMKAAIVSADEREKGKRALLNLGHTFGHAIEREAGYNGSVLHGEAVALGCLMAMELSVRLGHSVTRAMMHTLTSHYNAVGLPCRLSDLQHRKPWDAETLMYHTYQDKKSSHSRLNFVVLNQIGQATMAYNVDADMVEAVFEEFI